MAASEPPSPSLSAFTEPLHKTNSFFDSPRFSDIDICFGDERIKAHKIILVQGSPWFNKIFTDEVKQEHVGELHMEDDPEAVKGIISWLYGLKYDGKEHYSKNKGGPRSFFNPKEPIEAAEYARYLVSLFAAATVYQIGTLPERTKAHFPTVLATAANLDGTDTHVDSIARQVYLEHATAAKELRVLIVNLIAKNMVHLDSTPQFGQMLLNIQELAAELVHALATEAKAKASTEAKPDNNNSKRKAESQEGQPKAPPNLRTPASTPRPTPPAFGMGMRQPVVRAPLTSPTPAVTAQKPDVPPSSSWAIQTPQWPPPCDSPNGGW